MNEYFVCCIIVEINNRRFLHQDPSFKRKTMELIFLISNLKEENTLEIKL